MAAKRAKKSKKAKSKKRVAAKTRRPASKARKAAKRPAKRSKAKAAKRAPAKKAKKARATSKGRRKEVFGEGNYTASREFDKEQASFVKKNKSRIAKLGKEAEAALEGPQGDELREAEKEARGHSHVEGSEE